MNARQIPIRHKAPTNYQGKQWIDHLLMGIPIQPGGSWAQDLWVSQPSFVQGTEGSSIILPCSYNSSRVPRLGSYLWVKEVEGARLEVSNGTQEFRGRVSRALDRSFLQERRADVEIRELRLYDSGTYRCLVKIPSLGEGVGNGTWLRVVKAGELWGKPGLLETATVSHPPLSSLLLPSPTTSFSSPATVTPDTGRPRLGAWHCHRNRFDLDLPQEETR
uniref:Natural cytotoxicity triggering receptor 3 n=1 Tax=Pelusios castaneus TaxID=367368 RepID=A0A8C8RD88_9SAUR